MSSSASLCIDFMRKPIEEAYTVYCTVVGKVTVIKLLRYVTSYCFK
jgi:hypothetical protein